MKNMYCVKCGYDNTKVIDSRITNEGKSIRRRRECENCKNRFTTFESIEIVDLIVNKAGDKKERYNRNKLEDSILKACNKRNVSIQVIQNIVDKLELAWIAKEEINSKDIGAAVLLELRSVDEVAYIRYASVNLKFHSASDFIDFIKKEIQK